MSYFSWRTQKR